MKKVSNFDVSDLFIQSPMVTHTYTNILLTI